MGRMVVYAGIDYSVNSPAICVHPANSDWAFNNCVFFVKPKSKRQSLKLIHSQFRIYSMRDDIQNPRNRIEKYIFNANEVMRFFSEFDVDHVAIEGYAFGSRGQAITRMAENGGILRHVLYQNFGFDGFTEYSPQAIKKFATGKGTAKKEEMVDTFVDETGFDPAALLNLGTKYITPVPDLVDAYYICKALHFGLDAGIQNK